MTPLETYRAVNITSQAAKDVVKDMVTDSLYRARHAVVEARAVAERSRAKAELMEDRPCPDVRCAHTTKHILLVTHVHNKHINSASPMLAACTLHMM